MIDIFPDLLRAVITDIMLVALLCTMSMPKYRNRWVYISATAIILAANISANSYFYLSGNYTAVFYVDLAMLLIIGIALKPLFTDKIMQWCFSYITMLNIYVAIVFLSYMLSVYFPSPIYANTLLRLILFSAVIFVFYRRVSSIYRHVLNYWNVYILPVAMLFVCFMWYFFGGDIEEMLIKNQAPLILLILLGISVYIAIIHSLNTITEKYAMREENQKMQSQQEYLHLAADSMSQRLMLMEEAAQQSSRAAHDRRHFNNVILELLEQKKLIEAAALLKNQAHAAPTFSRVYCENPTVNASVSHYASLAEKEDIKTHIELDIPDELAVDSLELAMAISNLMENAVLACRKLPHERKRHLRFICRSAGRLIMEMENSCPDDTTLDKEGYPVAREHDHGIGSKSVLAFAQKYDGELIYRIKDGKFQVRLLV